MVKYTKRKKRLIEIIKISQVERHKQFEIKLPSNVKRITGVTITTALTES